MMIGDVGEVVYGQGHLHREHGDDCANDENVYRAREISTPLVFPCSLRTSKDQQDRAHRRHCKTG